MAILSKDIFILAMGQALTTTVVAMLTTVSSLSGAYLAPSMALSTLPVSATILGTLIMIYPASWLMAKLGRKGGFMLKAGVGVLGGVICGSALLLHYFALLVFGAFLLGVFSAFGQYYRFAAIDAARNPDEHASAMAMVMGAGVVGGIAGPFLSSRFAGLFTAVPYAGAFVAMVLVCLLLAISQYFLSSSLGSEQQAPQPIATTEQKFIHADFIYTSMLCAIAFAVMTLVMNAAPLSMQHDHFALSATSTVLQVHFILMYLPSFFNPVLIRWFGRQGLVAVGIMVSMMGCLLTFLPEQTMAVYLSELGLAGLGWNFMFNGATLLLAQTYTPAMKTKAQGLNSLIVYSANIMASLAAGILMSAAGWPWVNLFCLPLLLFATLLLWKIRQGRCI
ncbi:MFS transporter [Neisseriaceae bacterium ESL0693]|nr:MFS transporter [Neisseriaceae bacterium ESL0693]